MYTCPKGNQISLEDLESFNNFLQNSGIESGLSALDSEEQIIVVSVTTNHHPIRKVPNSIIALGFLNRTTNGGYRTEMYLCPSLPPEMKRVVGIDITNRLLAAY